MTIRSIHAYVSALWDWGFLDNCFGSTRIRVTDIDGLIERNGKFLLLEAKGIGVEIPVGQQRLFKALVQQGWTVIVIWCWEANNPAMILVMNKEDEAGREIKPATLDDLRNEVSKWFLGANAETCRV